MIHGLWFIHECDADRYISQDHNTHLSHLLLQLEYFLITKPSSTQSNKTTIQYMHCNTSQPPHTVHRAKQVQPISFCVRIKHYKLCKYSYLSYCSFEAQIKVPCNLGAQEAKQKINCVFGLFWSSFIFVQGLFVSTSAGTSDLQM